MIIFLQVGARRVNQRSAIRYLTPSPGWGWIIGVSRERLHEKKDFTRKKMVHFFSKTEGHLFGKKMETK
jgi:hypothetical protein